MIVWAVKAVEEQKPEKQSELAGAQPLLQRTITNRGRCQSIFIQELSSQSEELTPTMLGFDFLSLTEYLLHSFLTA